jgi:phosphate starvation-inducible protein PhoH and related proteins
LNRVRKIKSNDKRRVPLVPATANQREYVDSIRDNEITICNGLAGTGKTLIAIHAAVELLEKGLYERIIIVRPAVEACGEKIGFLPGGINDKMKPLVAPIIDNLRVFIKDEGYITALMAPEEMRVEVIPLAFMRGRTLNNCVAILDEAQNTSPEQMKLFLTRIGHNCKAIIEGDESQSDLDIKNGLEDIIDRDMDSIEGIGYVELGHKDIMRSGIVSKILSKYPKD